MKLKDSEMRWAIREQFHGEPPYFLRRLAAGEFYKNVQIAPVLQFLTKREAERFRVAERRYSKWKRDNYKSKAVRVQVTVEEV